MTQFINRSTLGLGLNLKKILTICSMIGLFMACKETKKEQPVEKKEEVRQKDTVIVVKPVEEKPKAPVFDSTYDQIASYIAGIHQAQRSVLHIEEDSVWANYAASMDRSWTFADTVRHQLLRQWSDSESLASMSKGQTLFYPFSGPDFLNAHILFPNCKEYILVGLEPVGQLPQLLDKQPKETYGYLEAVNKSLQDILHSSFFHTKKMKVHFKTENVNGALPIIAIFIKRTGHVITNVEALKVQKDGSLEAFAYDSLTNPKFKANGAKVTFMNPNTYELKNFYFFSQDLSNTGLADKTAFRHYLDSLNGYFAFAKSASYLMHYDYFSIIRTSILERATGMMQDDTGIPYKYFDPEKWDVTLYGKYIKPVKPFAFAKFVQKDLMAKYKIDSSHIEKLPFSLGYNQLPNKTNLLIARRK